MVSFQRITLSFLLVSGAPFAYLIPREPSYPCHDDADFGRRFIYRQQVARPQEYRYDADLRQNRGQEERGSHRVDSESDRLKQRLNVRTMIRTFFFFNSFSYLRMKQDGLWKVWS